MQYKTMEELKSSLAGFIGTESYHQWSQLFPGFVLTDGAKYLADEAGCYWLMDLIAANIYNYKEFGFAVIKAIVNSDSSGDVIIEDGDYKILARQHFDYVDLPAGELKLYVQKGATYWVIMLITEY